MNKMLDFLNKHSGSSGKGSDDTSPLVKNAKDYVASHGGNDRTAFMNLYKQYGINMPSNVTNPEEALKILVKQTGINPFAVLGKTLNRK